MARKRCSGHYCWSCDTMLPNERFSGRGHARHLCKACAWLGKKELAYRQAIRDLERLVTWEGFIRRKRREQFRKYLEHEDERVRAYAIEIEVAAAWRSAAQRLDEELDDYLSELAVEEGLVLLRTGSLADLDFDGDYDDDYEIPF